MKKTLGILGAFAIGAVFFGSVGNAATGISTNNFFKKVGDYILLKDSTWKLGSPTQKISNIYADTITADNIVSSTTTLQVAYKELYATSSPFQGGVVSVPHGLTYAQIRSIFVKQDYYIESGVSDEYSYNSGYRFSIWFDNYYVNIANSPNASGSILNKPLTVFITYKP